MSFVEKMILNICTEVFNSKNFLSMREKKSILIRLGKEFQ